MNKKEAAWLIVRTSGALTAIWSISKIGSLLYLAQLFFSGALREEKGLEFYAAVPGAIGCIVLGAIAAYLLRGGSKLHTLLMRE